MRHFQGTSLPNRRLRGYFAYGFINLIKSDTYLIPASKGKVLVMILF